MDGAAAAVSCKPLWYTVPLLSLVPPAWTTGSQKTLVELQGAGVRVVTSPFSVSPKCFQGSSRKGLHSSGSRTTRGLDSDPFGGMVLHDKGPEKSRTGTGRPSLSPFPASLGVGGLFTSAQDVLLGNC